MQGSAYYSPFKYLLLLIIILVVYQLMSRVWEYMAFDNWHDWLYVIAIGLLIVDTIVYWTIRHRFSSPQTKKWAKVHVIMVLSAFLVVPALHIFMVFVFGILFQQSEPNELYDLIAPWLFLLLLFIGHVYFVRLLARLS